MRHLDPQTLERPLSGQGAADAPPSAAAQSVRDYLKAQGEKTLLRFLTCGSVDDGKSTLIGRLLFDTKLVFEDQLATLESDSRRHGTCPSTVA